MLIKILKKPIIWVLVVEAILIILFFALGFKIAYPGEITNDNWNAIGAVGQWVGAIAGLTIPLVVVYIEGRLNKNKETIGQSNLELLKKLEPLLGMIDKDGNIIIDGGNPAREISDERKILKQKALECVVIGMRVTTMDVAEYIKMPKKSAQEYLSELQKEGKIARFGANNGTFWTTL